LSARELIYNRAGALRAPWRIVIFCFASAVCIVIASALVGPIVSQFFQLAGARGVSNEYWVMCAGMLGGTVFVVRYVDKRPWSDVWLGRDAARPSLLAIGFLTGAFAIGVPTAMLILAHWLRDAGSADGSWWAAGLRLTLTLAPAALVEELMTRGYILSVLREHWGWFWAVLATSIAFGLLHLANNGANVESVGLVTFAGFFLAAVLYSTRSLYAAWMAHFAWNWTMAVVFHTAVSGYPFESPRYRYVDAGPNWATGGDWGPEGGIPAGVGMVAGMAFLFARRGRRDDSNNTALDRATGET
jgi:hypothetical protein